jgi:ataxin-10
MRETHVRTVSVSANLAVDPVYLDMREHAIFTLHNLLEDNRENQAVVDAVQPKRQWDDNGVLQNTPRAVY